MSLSMRAAVMERADGVITGHRIAVEDLKLDRPRPGEVLVRLSSCGVCGTDRGCIHGAEPVPTPLVLGHAGAGIVEEVGSEVTQFAPGDKVLLGLPFCGNRPYLCCAFFFGLRFLFTGGILHADS